MALIRRPGSGPWTSYAHRLLAVVGAAMLLLALSAPVYAAGTTSPNVAPAGDTPTGFYYGTDSDTVSGTGSAPYSEPVIGGAYGGYIGMVGNWSRWQGCGTKFVWSATNSAQANTNFTTYKKGIGTGVYWFMGGPGVDPHYNGTTQEAYAWGRAQAARARADIATFSVKYPVVFMDIEIPGNAPSFTPAPDNGWNAVYTSPCSGRVKTNFVAPSLDRQVFNGFSDYIKHDTSYIPGVYSAPGIWANIFGTGGAASIPNTDEWTYTDATASLQNPPSGWCLRGTSTCAHFFGGVGQSSSHAVMWQWSGGGGLRNGYGDFDQIDTNRQR
ncbi:MAG TPA: hypothetical protein VGH85_11725 [Mycobacteriales bacterium]